MSQTNKLTLKDTSKILGGMSTITITRISKTDTQFPPVVKIGRSIFIDRDLLYKWLSEKSGLDVKPQDHLLTSKDLQEIFNKSHTWIWSNVKLGALPKSFKINRSTFWLNSQIDALLQSDEA